VAIIKPTSTDSTPHKWTGVCPIAICEFKDRSGEFNWADLFISCEVNVEGSEYSRNIEIAGELEKDGSGKITGGNVLTRLYRFFEVIGFQGGLTADGKWEDGDGNAIDNIANYLNERYLTGSPIDAEYKYVTYVYRAKPKQKGGKIYTRCIPKIAHNNNEGTKEIERHIDWMKTRGYLNEYIETTSEPSQMTASAVDNL
jgi:hypothetical protein